MLILYDGCIFTQDGKSRLNLPCIDTKNHNRLVYVYQHDLVWRRIAIVWSDGICTYESIRSISWSTKEDVIKIVIDGQHIDEAGNIGYAKPYHKGVSASARYKMSFEPKASLCRGSSYRTSIDVTIGARVKSIPLSWRGQILDLYAASGYKRKVVVIESCSPKGYYILKFHGLYDKQDIGFIMWRNPQPGHKGGLFYEVRTYGFLS